MNCNHLAPGNFDDDEDGPGFLENRQGLAVSRIQEECLVSSFQYVEGHDGLSLPGLY